MSQSTRVEKIRILKEMPRCVAEDLITLRSESGRFQVMSGRQWVDLSNPKYHVAIENEPDSDGKLPFDYRTLTVGGYTFDQLSQGLKKAQEAKDEEAVKMIQEVIQLYYNKLRSVRPVITVKKVLGWNAGYIMNLPWFSTCWEDKRGRIMMDVLFSAEKLGTPSDADIDEVCDGNGIYHKLKGFKIINPFEDKINYTFYVDRYGEGKEKVFHRVVLMLQEAKDKPKVCDAEFYAPDVLRKFNETAHVVKSKVFRRIAEKRRLDNAVLKEIPAEDIRMFYYNQENKSREFVIVTEKQGRADKLVEVGKNILAKRVDYIWYTGTYGTSELIPDNLNAKLGVVLDDLGLREKYGNANTTFALDDLGGWAEVNGWATVNNQTEHLVFGNDFQNDFLDILDNKLELPERMMRSNVQSDLNECWRKVIEKYYRMKEGSLKCERLKRFPAGLTAGKVLAFTFATSEAREWPGRFEVVFMNSDGKLRDVSVECMGERNASNLKKMKELFPFLDSGEMARIRDNLNKAASNEERERFVSSFDMLRGGHDYVIPDAKWRWYDIGFGNHLFVPNKYAREIFGRERVRQCIKDEKLRQIAGRNRQELYDLVLAQWVKFFDEVV